MCSMLEFHRSGSFGQVQGINFNLMGMGTQYNQNNLICAKSKDIDQPALLASTD